MTTLKCEAFQSYPASGLFSICQGATATADCRPEQPALHYLAGTTQVPAFVLPNAIRRSCPFTPVARPAFRPGGRPRRGRSNPAPVQSRPASPHRPFSASPVLRQSIAPEHHALPNPINTKYRLQQPLKKVSNQPRQPAHKQIFPKRIQCQTVAQTIPPEYRNI